MNACQLLLCALILSGVPCGQENSKQEHQQAVQGNTNPVSGKETILEAQYAFPVHRMSLPMEFSLRMKVPANVWLSKEVNQLLKASGVGQRISLDIRKDRDSLGFIHQVQLSGRGMIRMGTHYVVWAQNDAGEASEKYLLSLDRAGKLIDVLKVRRTLCYRGNVPLDVLQSRIDEQGEILTVEVVYPGTEYINVLTRDIQPFEGYFCRQRYRVNKNGNFEKFDSLSSKPETIHLNDLFGKNLLDRY